jgi:hypothetical protein
MSKRVFALYFQELMMPFNDEVQSGSSRTTAVGGKYLSEMSIDEKRTYQKWKRATFIVYGAVAAIVAMLLIAIGPTDKTANSKGEMHSSLEPAADKSR